MLNVPKLATAPTILAVWVASPSCSDAQEQMKVRGIGIARSTEACPAEYRYSVAADDVRCDDSGSATYATLSTLNDVPPAATVRLPPRMV